MNKHKAMASITIVVLCVSVLILSSYGLNYANYFYDGHNGYIRFRNCENVIMQSASFLDRWFLDSVAAKRIPRPPSPRFSVNWPDINPVYEVPPVLYRDLSLVNSDYKIEMYIVNANYLIRLPDKFNELKLIKKKSDILIKKTQDGNENFGINGYYGIILVNPKELPEYRIAYKKEFYGERDREGNIRYYTNLVSVLSLTNKDK